MIRLEVVEPDFSYRDCTKYKLLLQIDRGALSYFVLSPLGRLMALGNFPFDSNAESGSQAFLQAVRSVLMDQKILHHAYKQIVAGLDLSAPMLLPGTGHKPEDIQFAAGHGLTLNDGEILMTTEDEQLDLTFAFPVESELLSILNNFFPGAQIVHAGTALLRFFLMKSVQQKNSIVIYSINPPGMSIAVLQQGKVIFFNKYDIPTPNDMIYYAMLVNTRLQLKHTGTDFYAVGKVADDSQYLTQLRRYNAELKAVDHRDLITFSELSEKWAKSYFTDLFSLYLCV